MASLLLILPVSASLFLNSFVVFVSACGIPIPTDKMALDTRASRKLKDEDSNISKNHSGGKSNDSNETSNANAGSTTKGTYSLRRSIRETPSKKQRSSSP
ncbi:hypothetical protein MRB53_010308 [Persea americana]|uniref:Uncharacterized protein n=1 Tax=Persea americana TaxID=3435 RepID=A0ACC2LRD6_PERAE|nr:hypothetical protein MRB53_010308 [Persea americana]